MIFVQRLWLAVVLTVCLGLVGSTSAQLTSLVENGGFEQGMSGWDAYQYGSGWTTSSDNPHSGNNCLVFTFPAGIGYYDAAVRLAAPLTVVAGTPYRFSFWLRESGTHDTWTSDETILDNSVTVGGTAYYLAHTVPSTEWRFVSGVFFFETGGDAMIDIEVHGYSTTDPAIFAIDDLSLEEVNTGWCDDFEGSDWATNWHGSGNSAGIAFDNSIAHTGLQSLRMFGTLGSCWAAVVTRPLQFENSLELTFAVRNGTEPLNGCHPYRAAIGLRTGGPNWEDCPCPSLIDFLPDGSLRVHNSPNVPVVFAGYPLDVWHQVRCLLATPGDGLLHNSVWVNGEFLGEFTIPEEPWMHSDAYFDLSSQEGTVWFDDVCVNDVPTNVLRLGNSQCLLSMKPSELWVPVYLDNVEPISGADIPLHYSWSIDPIAVSFVGTRLEGMDYMFGDIDAANNILRIGFLADLDGSGTVLEPVDELTTGQPIAKLLIEVPYECSSSSLEAPEVTTIVGQYDEFKLELVNQAGIPSVPNVTSEVTELRHFRMGDVYFDGVISIADPVNLINYIFAGTDLDCPDATDADCDGVAMITDAVYLINYIFADGPLPGIACLCGNSGMFAKSQPLAAKIVATEVASNTAKILKVAADVSGQLQAAQLNLSKVGDVFDINVSSQDPRLQVFSGWVEGEYRVGVIDLTGKTTVPAGTHDLLTISYEGEGELVLQSAIVVDSDAQEMTVTISSAKSQSILPTEFALAQNRPNPFNPTTEISFSLPTAAEVTLVIYNVLGENVAMLAEGLRAAGTHSVMWDGRDKNGRAVASGVYFYRLDAGEYSATRKMLLLK